MYGLEPTFHCCSYSWGVGGEGRGNLLPKLQKREFGLLIFRSQNLNSRYASHTTHEIIWNSIISLQIETFFIKIKSDDANISFVIYHLSLFTDKLLHIQLLSNAPSLNMFQNAIVSQHSCKEDSKTTMWPHISYASFLKSLLIR